MWSLGGKGRMGSDTGAQLVQLSLCYWLLFTFMDYWKLFQCLLFSLLDSFMSAESPAGFTQSVSTKINLIAIWLRLQCKKIHLAITIRILEVVLLTFLCWQQSRDAAVKPSPGCLCCRKSSSFHLQMEQSEGDTEELGSCRLLYFSNMPVEYQRSRFGL